MFLVGGPLRDLLVERASLDVDLVAEGDGIALARTLTASLGTRPRVHPAFGTATVTGDHWHIDVATARRETYRRPGALPDVTRATVDDDLRRRDFTINAMALRLDGPDAGTLLDPLGGESDLRHGLIRVLHEGSFRDDATRILRAARYQARFRFQMEPQTLAWLRRDTPCLDTITGARLHREFSRIFREAEPELALSLLDKTGALAAIHSGLAFPPERLAVLGWLRSAHPHGLASACWPLLASAAAPGQASGAARRVALTKTQTAAVEAMPRLRELAGALHSPSLRRSELVDILAPFPVAALWAFAAVEAGPVRERCLDYLERARHLKTVLRGDDVIALGVRRGPEVGDVLRRLRTAKLDGEVKTRRDEERFVRGLLAGAPAR
ncbi:MAG TPA: hypothetical protein VFP63_08195 [Dehalococcoidia bacterium]|nr:hypothetical protein [Dehalococcoidia bacterium]